MRRDLPTHQRMKPQKVIYTLARDPHGRPSLFSELDLLLKKLQLMMLQRCDGIRSMSDIVVCIDEAFVYRAAFKTLEPGGLLDDMREWGPPHQKRTYYGSSHLHQFMRKCVMERKFSYGVPVPTNSAGFDIYESDRVFIPVNRSGVHCTDCGIFMIGYIEYWNGEPNSISFSQGNIEAYRDKIAMSLLLSPLNRKEEDSSSRCFAWNGGSGAKVQWRKT
ncbi:hypothetical protein HHK36_027273 [Tetracentron sinense]|uniref:Ubiquitin-like protease family profile domain-containing protein n=1 Tax=Tetracentron sinense TaxID=13715 RepID=A0A834YMU2_TETSI|nr:hypothetical protein HHK36_027273 [Tetracentron sinense]